jgi:hypothetical protein
MIDDSLLLAIKRECYSLKVPEKIACGLAMAENSGNWFGSRYKKYYSYIVDPSTGEPFRVLNATEKSSVSPPGDFPGLQLSHDQSHSPQAEWEFQRTSWGLFQIMGAVARELGFRGSSFDVNTPSAYIYGLNGMNGVIYGLLHFKNYMNKYEKTKGIEAAIASYNAGSPRRRADGRYVNQAYVDKVMQYASKF